MEHRTGQAAGPRRGEATVSVSQDLDIATVGQVRREVQRALDRRPERLLLDMSGCDFSDATGVSLLVGVQRDARAQGCGLRVTRPSPAVRRLLGLCGLSHGLVDRPEDHD